MDFMFKNDRKPLIYKGKTLIELQIYNYLILT